MACSICFLFVGKSKDESSAASSGSEEGSLDEEEQAEREAAAAERERDRALDAAAKGLFSGDVKVICASGLPKV